MSWTIYLFSVCARRGRSFLIKMRKLPLIKNAVLLIIMVWLSLKVWITISDIANAPRNTNGVAFKNSVNYRYLAKDSPAKEVPLPHHLDKITEDEKDFPVKESLDEDLITDEMTTSTVESLKTTQESKDKAGQLKTRTISSLKANADKNMWKRSPQKINSLRTTTRKGSSQETTTGKSEPRLKDQTIQPYTIKVKSNIDVLADKMTTTPLKITEKRHVMLLKVHKCGSSSVQNIFLRFGFWRNLTFILAHDNKTKSESGYTNVISYKNTLSDELIVPPPPGRHFDILCCHVIYNEEQFEMYLPEDTVYIGIVREPVKRLESSFNYFHMYKNVEMSDFASDPLKYERKFPSMANNRMAFEFGFPRECFPSLISNSSIETTQKLVSSYLKSIDKKFDFIIINERMDESLVYMKRLLGWQLKDILYARLLTAKGTPRKFTEQDALKLMNFLYLDYALYDYAVRRFEEKIANVSVDFQEEVKLFKDIKDSVGQFCKTKSNATFTVEPSRWNEEFAITRDDCQHFSQHEMKFIQEIRQKQYGTINN